MRSVLLLMVLLPACGADFDPYNRLTGLRVLAIQSEPPEPGPGDQVLLRPLIYAPPNSGPLTYAWSWCPIAGPANDGYPCVIPGTDLGTTEEISFPTPDAQVVQDICALITCLDHVSVQVRLVVTSGAQRLDSVYTLYLRLVDGDINANPQIGQVQVLGTLARDAPVWLYADVQSDQAQTYQDQREQLLFTWFVESGDTDLERTSFIEGVQSIDHATQIAWTPATREDYPRDTSRVIVVVRDNRGGVSWNDSLVVTLP